MSHEAKKFELKGLEGLSDSQISQHRDILYVGYVNKLNEIEDKLKTSDRTKANQIYSEYRGLKADETFALNGVILHELYFENMGGRGGNPTGQISDLIKRDFGSVEKWTEDFKACGMAVRGWVVLAYNLWDGKLHNYGADAHHFNFPAMAWPLLVMDVYEHAYTIDYGVKRPPYIDVFMKNINWDVANKRLDRISKLF
ncbi:MAG: superoxide dismutase [Nitrospirae bacterium]|nr:superoxide dismutase [Nitrospirota bacterium]